MDISTSCQEFFLIPKLSDIKLTSEWQLGALTSYEYNIYASCDDIIFLTSRRK